MRLDVILSIQMIVMGSCAFPLIRQVGGLFSTSEVLRVRRSAYENLQGDLETLFKSVACFPRICDDSE